jgi:tetraacyldisaccharide 4'-kinase
LSDEHKLIAISVKKTNVPVIASKNRAKSIEFAISNYNPDVVIMDDGFQNFSITKDLSIVIINVNELDTKLLPLGNFREGYTGIKRADFVVLNHCELFDDVYINEKINYIQKYTDHGNIIKSSYKPSSFIDLIENKKISLNSFKNKEIAIFSGIGDNTQFKKILEKMGFNILKSWQFSDHHSYTSEELLSINNLREKLILVTTLKDSVKFMAEAEKIFVKNIYALEVNMVNDYEPIISKISSIK